MGTRGQKVKGSVNKRFCFEVPERNKIDGARGEGECRRPEGPEETLYYSRVMVVALTINTSRKKGHKNAF